MAKIIIPKELHHSVCEQEVVRHARETVLGNLTKRLNGEAVLSQYGDRPLSDSQIMEMASQTVTDLLVIINRLTKSSKCKKCKNTGAVTVRAGGCRDSNEEIVCPQCKGRYVVKGVI